MMGAGTETQSGLARVLLSPARMGACGSAHCPRPRGSWSQRWIPPDAARPKAAHGLARSCRAPPREHAVWGGPIQKSGLDTSQPGPSVTPVLFGWSCWSPLLGNPWSPSPNATA